MRPKSIEGNEGLINVSRPVVQSLNSPFLPPHIGAEPARAKEESRITCMRMLRTPPFFPPNRGKNHIWKYFPDLACGAIFWIMIHKQQISGIHQCHAKPHSICFVLFVCFFFTTISKITKKHRLELESERAALCKWATWTRQTFLSKPC